jgi:hypothetical protein
MIDESLNVLFMPQKPWYLKAVCTHSDLTDRLWSLQRPNPASVIKFLRGKKMATVQGLFDEFSAALQFPYYFGNNAGAFDECMTDLSWLPGKMYAVIIFDSSDFLVSEPEQLPLFVDALEQICEQWSKPIEQGASWDRSAVPFHVIFQCVADDATRLPAKLAGITCVM